MSYVVAKRLNFDVECTAKINFINTSRAGQQKDYMFKKKLNTQNDNVNIEYILE